ncbi:MAG TPA: OmpA family protein [Saprospiraceae bacterium]|nr:OmpA family protein [Saprospiraceae bacterium]HMQ83802.1 OmpA family protein [Saprospiraceae bacterium]
MVFRLLIFIVLLPALLAAQPGRKAKALKNDALNAEVDITNLVNINTESLEFSPVFYANGMVFVSSRKKNGPIDQEIGETFFELFYCELDPNGIPMFPTPFSIQINSERHEGPVSFSQDGNRMYFTRNNLLQGVQKANSKGKVGLKIYEADQGYFDWENVRELPFNNNEYSCMHPSLSDDGKRLYFASDMPGGFGGFDLWVVLRTGTSWSEPINLGSRINTSDNEVFPFIHNSGILFFSSDGHKGYGGLDLFLIDLGKPEWGKVINLGRPFNSDRDDLGIILDPDGVIGYFSSDREGGMGKDDIYRFEAPEGIQGVEFPNTTTATLAVFDQNNGRRLPEVAVRVFEKTEEGVVNESDLYELELMPSQSGSDELVFKRVRKSEEDMEAPKHSTNSRGEAYLTVNIDKSYLILVSKAGYKTQEIPYVPSENIYNRPIDINLEPTNCLTLSGLVESAPFKKPIPNTTIKIFNQCDRSQEEIRTNINGTFEHCIEMGCDYLVVSEQPGYAPDSTLISTIKLRGRRSAAIVLKMAPQSTSIARQPIREGAVIVLQNIHYDFGKSAIRSGEAKDLEALAQLMQTYKSMEIELGAHTDCRGDESSNLKLSLDRAESAKQFLVTRGIAPHRIKAFGYGEAFLINHCNCDGGHDCPEEEHEKNRRTEVKITRMDESLEVEFNEKGIKFEEKN